MSNLTIENLSGMIKGGSGEQMLERSSGVGAIAPEAPALRAMEQEGMKASPAGEIGQGFGDMLKQSIEKTNEAQVQADHSIKELTAGRTKNIHETMLDIEKADTSLKLMMQVRNKVLDAYKEIMRMQV
jgi:flagellar hook-basal body complex protein FliE